MIQARLRSRISQEELESKVGKILGPQDFNMLLTGPTKLLKPNGQPLVIYLPGALLDLANTPSVYDTFHKLKSERTENRGMASGSRRVPSGSGNKSRALPVPSSIIGAFDAAGHQKYCRLTAWTGANLPQWEALRPFLLGVADNFKRYLPDRYEVQMEQVRATYPEWVVPGTPFSTVTVNNCVDDQTTCLTREHGWTTHQQLKPGDLILAYDPATHTTQWQPVIEVFVNEAYDGEMVALNSRGLSALTTPDHRWPLQRTSPATDGGTDDAPLHAVMTSSQLPDTRYWSLLRNAPHATPQQPVHSDAFVRLVAWYMTEGTRTDTSLTLAQSDRAHPTHVDAIRRDLKALGGISLTQWRAQHPDNRARRQGLVVNEFHRRDAPDIVNWVLTGTGTDALRQAAPGRDKVPTMAFLTSLTAAQARLFVETCIMADGSPEWGRFYQHHEGRMEAFMVAAVLAGQAPSLDRSGIHCLLRRSRRHTDPSTLISLKAVKRETVPYTGTIWCPRVPSGHWVARRNGTVYLTGNTYPTGVHLDAGDLEAGFSTLACLRKGTFTGGQLVFPKFRVAIDMQHGDLALIDAHEHHGNTAIFCACGERRNGMCDTCGAERISVVSYFRANMTKCGTFPEEAARAMSAADARNRKKLAAALDVEALETPSA